MRTKQFTQIPLRVHSLLTGIPIRTLERVELPGGRERMTLQEVSDVVGFGGEVTMKVGPITKALFWLRTLIGRVLRWDEVPELIAPLSYVSRLTEDDISQSIVTPGKAAGISHILYQFEHEMLGEIINRTVHCFWVMATECTPNGYVLWFAVYVKKLNWFTPIYMTLISPMLKWIIYPSMLEGIRRRWVEAFPLDPYSSQFREAGT